MATFKYKTENGWRDLFAGVFEDVNGELSKKVDMRKNLSDLEDKEEAIKILGLTGENNKSHFHDDHYVPMIEKVKHEAKNNLDNLKIKVTGSSQATVVKNENGVFSLDVSNLTPSSNDFADAEATQIKFDVLDKKIDTKVQETKQSGFDALRKHSEAPELNHPENSVLHKHLAKDSVENENILNNTIEPVKLKSIVKGNSLYGITFNDKGLITAYTTEALDKALADKDRIGTAKKLTEALDKKVTDEALIKKVGGEVSGKTLFTNGSCSDVVEKKSKKQLMANVKYVTDAVEDLAMVIDKQKADKEAMETSLSELNDKLNSKIDIGIAGAVPTGTVVWFAAKDTYAPSGWHTCFGQKLSKTKYKNLYDVIGGLYGEDAETFNVPDLRKEFIRGASDYDGVGKKQGDAIRNITGELSALGNSNYGSGAFSCGGAAWDGSASHSRWANRTVYFNASRVVPTADENRPRNIALLPIIKG